MLDNRDLRIRRSAIEELGKRGIEATDAQPKLIKMLDDDTDAQPYTAITLGKLGCKGVVPKLLQMLRSENRFAQMGAALALGYLNDETAISTMLKTLEDGDSKVRSCIASALGMMDGKQVTSGLLQAIRDEHPDVRWNAAQALGNLKNEAVPPSLLPRLTHCCCLIGGDELIEAIATIQKRCQFYNYTIAQSPSPPAVRLESESENQGRTVNNYYDVKSVGNLNTGNVTIHGDQIGKISNG